MSNVLILIDIQKEYVTKERPFYLHGIDESLRTVLVCWQWQECKIGRLFISSI